MTKAMRRWELTLLTIAIVWAAALPILALVVPIYQGESVDMRADGTTVVTSSSATLVDVNGGAVIGIILVPLFLAVIFTLLLRARRPGQGPGVAATVVMALLAAGTFLAMLTVGIYVVPVTGCVVGAWAIRVAAAQPKSSVRTGPPASV